jgi:recombination protein RecA
MANKKEAEVSEETSRALRLGDAIKGMKKKYKGASLLANARDDERLIVPRISTGLYSIDVAMNGGFPLHRVSMVYGEAKGGKTTILQRSMGNLQRLCGNCFQPAEFVPGRVEIPDLETGELKQVETYVIKDCPCGHPKDIFALWIDAEGVWLPEWAEKMGVWAEKVILSRPTYGEQGYDILTSFGATGSIDLMVLDSIAAMSPEVEFTGGMEEQHVGKAARMNNMFVRKIVSLMNLGFQKSTPMTMWAVNQYRQKIGVQRGSAKTLPGGKGQLFSTSMELEMAPGKIEVDDNGDPMIGEFYWQVKKNKLGPSGGKGTFKQWMTDTDLFSVGDLYEYDTVIARAVDMGLIEHPNSVMYHFNDLKFRGINVFVRYFGENPEVYHNLKETMIRRRLRLDE